MIDETLDVLGKAGENCALQTSSEVSCSMLMFHQSPLRVTWLRELDSLLSDCNAVPISITRQVPS